MRNPLHHREKLLGVASNNGSSKKDEEFNLNEDDVSKEVIEGVPSITFLERVHDFIARRMSKTWSKDILSHHV